MNYKNEQVSPPGETDFDLAGSLAWVVENLTFALGMALMFSKTVDLMAAFAPATIFGYSGVALFYGLAVGVLIEGALFVMKLTLPRAKNVVDWLWTVVVIVTPFLISALAQVFDSFRVGDALKEQPQEIQTFISWFVPSIPTIIMALLLGKSIFSSIPKELMQQKPTSAIAPSLTPVTLSSPKPDHGDQLMKRLKNSRFVGRFMSPPKKQKVAQATDSPIHPPTLCAVCRAELPFIEYGSKIGKDSKPAKWPIYEKCVNPKCTTGRKNLGLPKALPGSQV